jgi:hypothetical protein
MAFTASIFAEVTPVQHYVAISNTKSDPNRPGITEGYKSIEALK